ncbi:hypothetical protein [Streptomyces chilikensis]|uniref:hypothetical protein n=1 Tax=Streptomyces chilikensis TaxID=1194079 RepID=UPI000A495EC1|nr:hypothetical protein [Streptomyces chilikensis]
MSDSTGPWEPSARVAALLFTDFDGGTAGPDDVIADALDGGYRERSEGLHNVLRDPGEDPVGRFLACVALTRWADPAGYEEVVRSAGAPAAVAWRGASCDRLHGQDDSFGVLADAVGDSADMVEERGTAAERLRAADALLSVADRVQFDRHISSLMRQDVVASCLATMRTAVDRGIARLGGERVPHDLGLQLALMTAAAHSVDDGWSRNAAHRLVEAKPGERALRELSDVMPDLRET